MRDSKEIIQLIKKLRKEKKMSVEYLANKVGVSKSTQSRYENGLRGFPINDVGKYAEALGTSIEYLLGIDNLYALSDDSVHIPILGEIACGEPILAKENFAGYKVEPKETLPSGNLYYLKAKGESMEPTIPDGSMVLIRQQPDVENNEIAAVLVNGDNEATLKRIIKQGNSVVLMPDNPKFTPYIVNEDNPARIIGKAIRYTREL